MKYSISLYSTKLIETWVAISKEGRIRGKYKIGIANVFDFEYIVKKATMQPAIARSKVPIVITMSNKMISPLISTLRKTMDKARVKNSMISSSTIKYTNLAIKMTCGLTAKERIE